MKSSIELINKIIKIKDISPYNPCLKCSPCLALRLMELGLINGQKIEIKSHQLGLWLINILSDNNTPISTIALRENEIERIIFDDENCGLIFA